MTCRIEKVDIANIFIYNIQKGVTTMAQTNINIRIDEDLKNQFEAFCSDIGMTMTTAFCVFAKAAVRKQKIPFEISTDPFYSESNMSHLRRGIEALNAGKWVEHELIEAGE
ncbi:RelB/DinJ family addiction module antitoxin [Treponema denticola SP33]|uniref:RelB/DinJ family addiction module antitoxin n=2 Tax=Treponema denticola TaxID=158 RepID=M2AP86_TREDN|nr:RelB/DinJ family addiction module antitoxin [Treponema denticola SP33]EPF36665.1 RelB/DinJ family addiction module antitoxin [Treponema denticola SP32]